MWIKRAPEPKLRLPDIARKRWARLLAVVGGLLLLVLGSVYHGMNLVKSGRSMSLKDWISGVAKEKLGVVPNYLGSLTAKPERFEIDIKFKHQQKLAHKRDQALELGRLFSGSDDWVPAKIRHRGHTYDVSLRLKGDLSDHWRRPDRWSYKVKVKNGEAILGMKRFALQDPRTRKHMNEYVMHRLQEHLGLIALRYDFVDVTINGKHQPIYALEENFEKRLLENNRRREGPILRYDQWFYWSGDPGMAPELAGSSVRAYQEASYAPEGTPAATTAGGQFALATSLLEGFRQGDLTASEVFDVELLGTFFALCELAGYDHAASIDNLKFYFNPVTTRVEPIGYDFNHIRDLDELGPHGLISARALSGRLEPESPLGWSKQLFADDAFYAAYVAGLRRLCTPGFLDDFFDVIQADFDDKLAILHTSYPWYEFGGRKIFERNAEYLASYLSPECSLQAYLGAVDEEEGTIEVLLQNVHVLHAEAVALISPSGRRLELEERLEVRGHTLEENVRFVSARFPLPTGQDEPLSEQDAARQGWQLVYELHDVGREERQAVHPRPPIDSSFPGSFLTATDDALDGLEWLDVDRDAKRLRVRPGVWTLADDVVLPAGYLVVAEGGTTLRLEAGACFVSRSPLAWAGTDEHPIRVVSAAKPENERGEATEVSNGFVVLDAGERSRLSWVEFAGLDNPDEAGWELTGAVTFYESPVTISHCAFTDNLCEDALNIIRADFRIEHSLFRGIRSDAFDADFCQGVVADTAVIECGGDAIDVSGTELETSDLHLERIHDKGLSIGENSRARASNVTVTASEIAVASKDLSYLEIDGLTIRDCTVGFTVFQKKPEFGPGHVVVNGMTIEGVKVLHLIEQGSSLRIDGDEVDELLPDVKKLLYGAEYGKATER